MTKVSHPQPVLRTIKQTTRSSGQERCIRVWQWGSGGKSTRTELHGFAIAREMPGNGQDPFSAPHLSSKLPSGV
eukprot:7132996-Alexandrium_andersonii.AAC.1